MHIWIGPSKQMYLSYFTNKLFLNKAEYISLFNFIYDWRKFGLLP